jgi:hypothetical protein
MGEPKMPTPGQNPEETKQEHKEIEELRKWAESPSLEYTSDLVKWGERFANAGLKEEGEKVAQHFLKSHGSYGALFYVGFGEIEKAKEILDNLEPGYNKNLAIEEIKKRS